MKTQATPFFGLPVKVVWQLLLLFLIWRLGLGLVAGAADHVFIYAPSFPYADSLLTAYQLPRWLFSWANFDGVHYLTIAEKGYLGTGLIQAFFPFFPYLILRPLWLLFGPEFNTLLVGLLVTNLAAFLAVCCWFSLVAGWRNQHTAWVATITLLLFPSAFFLGALYTESLFLLAVLTAFWAAQKQQWGWVLVASLVATATRIVGIFLIMALLLELWQQWRSAQDSSALRRPLINQLGTFVRHSLRPLSCILAGSLGVLTYMGFLWLHFRDALYFFHVQQEFGGGRSEQLVSYPQVIWRYLKILTTVETTAWRYYSYVVELMAGVFGLVGVLLAAWRVRWSHTFFALGALLLPTLTGTFSSLPRYILVCFPLYLLAADWLVARPRVRLIVWFLLAVTLIINTMMFIQGYWIS